MKRRAIALLENRKMGILKAVTYLDQNNERKS